MVTFLEGTFNLFFHVVAEKFIRDYLKKNNNSPSLFSQPKENRSDTSPTLDLTQPFMIIFLLKQLFYVFIFLVFPIPSYYGESDNVFLTFLDKGEV